MGRLTPVRSVLRPYAWACCTSSLLAIAAVIAFPGDHSWWELALRSPWLLLGWLATGGFRSRRFVDAAREVPHDVPVDESTRRHWALAIVLAGVLLTPIVLGVLVDGDAASFDIFVAYLFGAGLSLASQRRRIASVEDERRADFLRARRRHGFRAGYYMRSRPSTNDGEGALQP